MINTQLKFEGKTSTFQKLLHSQGVTQTFKFQGRFDLEGQGHQFSNPSETFRCLINSLSWKVKFEMVQCLTVKINSTRQDSTSMNLMTEVIKCDAIEQSKLIKTWL